MKKTLLLAAFAVFSIASVSKAQIYLGPALLYGTNINEPGLQVSGYIPIPQVKKLSVGGDLSFYFPHSYNSMVLAYNYSYKETFWEINANAHYLFYDEKGLSAYGIGGLGVTTYHVKVTYTGYSGSSSTSKLGLNLGVGGTKSMSFGKIFAEVKYVVTSDLGHFTIGAGVRFPIKTK